VTSELFERYWAEQMEEFPELATMTGWPTGHDRWTDVSVEAVERRRRDAGRWLDEAAAVDEAALGEIDRQSLQMFRVLQQGEVDAAAFPAAYLPLNQLEGPQLDPAFFLGVMGDDWDNKLARLRAVPTVVDQTIQLLHEGLAQGVTPPAVCLREVPTQVGLHRDTTTSPLLGAFADATAEVRAEAEAIVADTCRSAYERLGTVLADYLPACRETIGLRDLPDGEAWYAERVRHHTTTDLTPQEIHEIGLAEVDRIHAAMDQVMSSLGFDDRTAFAEHLRTDPRHYFASEDELLRAYRDIAKRIDPGLARLFGRLPRLPFGIIPVPADQAPSQPAAYYMPGSLELGRAGMFYANTFDLGARPSWNLEAICLHEAAPGHHLQISLAQETDGLPQFRRQSLSCTAYIEGWGLYSESLGDELGMYDDPYQRYGALDAEMLRACRLVLDTGIHALGWTRDQAIEFFEAHSPSPSHELVVEVDRYIVWPGQALAYKVGSLKIQELRDRAAKALADRFDLRGFHDEVLRHGPLPLGMLESVIEDWLVARSLSS
jgi:uncharacterized protein (DUF885 family)